MSRLDIEKVNGVAIARVNEDIDAANAVAIQHELAGALGPDALCLVVDLSTIRYLDSAGIVSQENRINRMINEDE